MALSPEVEVPEIDGELSAETLRTYKINYETMEITNEKIGGLEAIQQFVYMALKTARYAYAIYSSDYGGEVEELIADKVVTEDFIKMELPRLITDALIYDDRITEVSDFNIEHINDSFKINFVVHSNAGLLEVEEVF